MQLGQLGQNFAYTALVMNTRITRLGRWVGLWGVEGEEGLADRGKVGRRGGNGVEEGGKGLVGVLSVCEGGGDFISMQISEITEQENPF